MAVHGIIGRKVGMTQVFGADGVVVPVTVVQAGPCLVVQKKTADKDGYDAIQIGLVDARPDRRANRAAKGRFEKAGVAPMRTLAEVGLRHGRRVEARRQGAVRRVPGRGPRGRHRRLQGQGVRRRRPPPPLQRRRRDARFDVSPRARLDRRRRRFRRASIKGNRSSGRLGGRQATSKNLSSCRSTRRRTSSTSTARSPGARHSIVKIMRSSFVKQGRAASKDEDGDTARLELEDGKRVGEVDLPAGGLRLPVPPAPRVAGVVKAYLAGQRRGTHKTKDAQRGLRLRQEAVQAEGHRPRAPGRRPSADPPPRRNVARAACRARTPTGVSVGEKKNALRGGPLAEAARRAARGRREHGHRRAHRTRDLKAAVGGSASRGRRSSSTRTATRSFARASRNVARVEARRSRSRSTCTTS